MDSSASDNLWSNRKQSKEYGVSQVRLQIFNLLNFLRMLVRATSIPTQIRVLNQGPSQIASFKVFADSTPTVEWYRHNSRITSLIE